MQSRNMLDMLAGTLTQRGLAHVRIDGTITSAEARQVLSALLHMPPPGTQKQPAHCLVTHHCPQEAQRRALRCRAAQAASWSA